MGAYSGFPRTCEPESSQLRANPGYDPGVSDGIRKQAFLSSISVRRQSADVGVTGSRHLSQAISEGDGISLLAPVGDAAAATAAERDGAEGIVLAHEIPGVRDATTLPILWSAAASAQTAARAGADAFVLRVETDDGDRLHELHLEAQELGLESVVSVSDEEQLALALEQVDPEIFLLSAHGDDEHDPLEGVLDLLPDVPAGKLAIAEVVAPSREYVLALERAGIDGVIVRAGDVSRFVGGSPPEV